RDILNLSVKTATAAWEDSDPTLLPDIEKIVTAHYKISIEQITFGKAMTKFPLLHKLFPFMLKRIINQLENDVQTSNNPVAIQDKIALNRQRLHYFEEDLNIKLNECRNKIREYIKLLPSTDALLFGEKPSSADIVTAVLFARLSMIGEEDLINESP
ncbi:MAG TPA: hypothetical protein PLD88_12310, partial [Candidatus Berkiella sp.]|nr:hypothetical protein [Candidatus Berkiella sp.]